MRRILFSILIISIVFTVTPGFTSETNILLGPDYFQSTRQAIQNAKESIYMAMYLINVESTPTDSPASILLEDLISAKKRGVYVKVILDDTIFKVNYNAYKRLQQAGIDVFIDSTKAVLHAKGIVIDSKISILGSFNWSRASLYNNYEFAAYIENPRQAKKLLEYISNIELSLQPPIQPEHPQGLKLPVSLLTSPPKPLLFDLFTSHSEKAFDLYLYLAKKAQNQHSNTIKINYQEFAQALGYTRNYYFNLFQPLSKLTRKYGLIQHKPWSKDLNLVYTSSESEITIPDTYWEYGFCQKLSFPAKYMLLVSLSEAQKSKHNPYWFRSNEDLSRIYYISERSITDAVTELEKENILEVYRHKPQGSGLPSDSQSHRPEEPGEFDDRPANDYRLNPLQSQEQFQHSLQALYDKYGSDITQKASELSSQLNEPKDLEKIEIYIGLIKTYGYAKVRDVNSAVASNRRESGFRDLSQVILLLKSA
ncbi:MAG: phospholipase D-like domain-containing protein [Candidatus Omnitrophota bacterium]|nr:phospholipase D-like domain-containing protein [Candidatus Omnitrophota bacterium]